MYLFTLDRGQRSAALGFLYMMIEDSPPDTVSWCSLSSCVLARRTSSCRGSKCSCRTPSCSSRRSVYTAPVCALARRWRSFSCASDRGTCAGSAPSEDGTGRAEELLAVGTMQAGKARQPRISCNKFMLSSWHCSYVILIFLLGLITCLQKCVCVEGCYSPVLTHPFRPLDNGLSSVGQFRVIQSTLLQYSLNRWGER